MRKITGLVIVLLLGSPLRAETRLEFIDGGSAKVATLALDSQGALNGEGVPAGLDLDDLREIVFAPPKSVAKRPVAAVLAPEGKLPAEDVTIAAEMCIFRRGGQPLAIRIDSVRAIRFDPTAAQPLFDEAVAAPLPNADRIFFLGEEKKLDSLNGMIEALTAEELKFTWEKQSRVLPRDQVFGIVFAGTAAGKSAPSLAHLQDGAILPGKLAGLSAEGATFLVGGGKVPLAYAELSRIEVRSSRIAYLSDLKPTAEEHSPLVTAPRPWQRDRAANGRPLTLKDRIYSKGLGTHAYAKLSFAAEGKFDRLVGVLGIDASAAGQGDCVFHILGDGNELFTRRVRGSDPPFDLQLEIRGVKEVTLVVEAGADLDLADYADWCELRFLKQAKPTRP